MPHSRPWFAVIAALVLGSAGARAQTTLLNVSYDSTRELYADIGRAFAADWKARTGETVVIQTTHGGSGGQSRAVIGGLEADVVTLALQPDIDAIASGAHLLPADWARRLPNHSVPYTSTILLVVRKGNPKRIHDWADLVRPGVSVIAPNPKTSGAGRWSYLAAWGYAMRRPGGTTDTARGFVRALYANVAELDRGERSAVVSFAQRNKGDVLIAWEDDANLAVHLLGAGKLELVVPSITIKAEPAVAVLDAVATKHGTTRQAEAYLRFLYSPDGQEIVAGRHYRPIDPAVSARFAYLFPDVPTFTVDDVFGSWQQAGTEHFADGAIFDQIRQPTR